MFSSTFDNLTLLIEDKNVDDTEPPSETSDVSIASFGRAPSTPPVGDTTEEERKEFTLDKSTDLWTFPFFSIGRIFLLSTPAPFIVEEDDKDTASDAPELSIGDRVLMGAAAGDGGDLTEPPGKARTFWKSLPSPVTDNPTFIEDKDVDDDAIGIDGPNESPASFKRRAP